MRMRLVLRPDVVAVAGEQPRGFAVALDDQAIAVMLHFVQPFGEVGTLVAFVGMQGAKGDLSMGKDRQTPRKCQSERGPQRISNRGRIRPQRYNRLILKSL
jgi:hypothetical protein